MFTKRTGNLCCKASICLGNINSILAIRKTNSCAKKELLLIPIIGALMKRAGCIAVDRKAGIGALKKLQREATVAKQTGRSILIFPQGTRVLPSDNTTPYQVGVFSIYQLLSLSVIPVALDSGHYWPSKTLLKNLVL